MKKNIAVLAVTSLIIMRSFAQDTTSAPPADSISKYLLYTIAAGATGTVAYCRYDAGQHFPTDIIIGAVQGTLAGILVPHFHKNRSVDGKGLTVMPKLGESYGVVALYRF